MNKQFAAHLDHLVRGVLNPMEWPLFNASSAVSPWVRICSMEFNFPFSRSWLSLLLQTTSISGFRTPVPPAYTGWRHRYYDFLWRCLELSLGHKITNTPWTRHLVSSYTSLPNRDVKLLSRTMQTLLASFLPMSFPRRYWNDRILLTMKLLMAFDLSSLIKNRIAFEREPRQSGSFTIWLRQPGYPRGTRGFPPHDCSWFGLIGFSLLWIID